MARGRRVRPLRRVAWSAVVCVVFFALVELGLRVAVPRDALLFDWERPGGLLQLNLDGTNIPRPGTDVVRSDGPYAWRTVHNADSLRETGDKPADKPADELRILALGDSWMYGWSVDQGKTIPDQVESILSARMGRPVEVLNGGVQGFCAFDMYMRWRQLQAGYEIDGVLLGMPHNVGNEASRAGLREQWLHERPGLPRSDSRLFLLMRRTVLRGMMPPPSALGAKVDAGVLTRAIGDVLRIADEARSLGLSVWFLTFPTRWSTNPADVTVDGEVQRTWARALLDRGIPVAGHQLPERACWGYEDEAHPGEAGARALAEVGASLIADELRELRARDTPRCSAPP